MTYLIQLFGNIPLSTIIIFIAAIVFIITLLIKIYKWIVKNHDELQNRHEVLDKLLKAVEELKADIKDIKAEQKDLKKGYKEIAEKQQTFEDEKRERTLHRVYDRLIQSYNYYTNKESNPMQAWSEMEKDGFEKLFQDYESLGGNGFMHNTVKPAMAGLKIVLMSDEQGLVDLAKSRKKG